MAKANDPKKFRGKYRIPSARAGWWDYSAPGAYFITICTAGRAHLFGRVQDGQMVLSPLGEIVREEWEKSFVIRQELACDAYVIMPNHLHAIVQIIATHVETDGRRSLHHTGVAYRPPRSVSSFVAGFKSAATKRYQTHQRIPGHAGRARVAGPFSRPHHPQPGGICTHRGLHRQQPYKMDGRSLL